MELHLHFSIHLHGVVLKRRDNRISSLMMEAARTSETSVDNYFTRQYIPEDNSELHTRRRENLKSQTEYFVVIIWLYSQIRARASPFGVS
jgi:hypothetical protein